MKALILNSGLGSRMRVLTKEHPKCMTDLPFGESILSRQLRLLSECGVEEAIITTGYYDKVLADYAESLEKRPRLTFVKNERYAETNYIFSIYRAISRLEGDILLLHGDLVFEKSVLLKVLASQKSCMTVSSTQPLPEKDFKAVVKEGRIKAVGIHFFESAVAAQPLYLLKEADKKVWFEEIKRFVEEGNDKVYAENALNEVSDRMELVPLDVLDALDAEVDTPEDLDAVSELVRKCGEGLAGKGEMC